MSALDSHLQSGYSGPNHVRQCIVLGVGLGVMLACSLWPHPARSTVLGESTTLDKVGKRMKRSNELNEYD